MKAFPQPTKKTLAIPFFTHIPLHVRPDALDELVVLPCRRLLPRREPHVGVLALLPLPPLRRPRLVRPDVTHLLAVVVLALGRARRPSLFLKDD